MPHRKTYKITVMTSSKQNFEKMKKVSSQIFVKIVGVHFHQNRTKIVEIKDPDRHTDTRTYRQGSSWDNIFSPEMTEYKNFKEATGQQKPFPRRIFKPFTVVSLVSLVRFSDVYLRLYETWNMHMERKNTPIYNDIFTYFI